MINSAAVCLKGKSGKAGNEDAPLNSRLGSHACHTFGIYKCGEIIATPGPKENSLRFDARGESDYVGTDIFAMLSYAWLRQIRHWQSNSLCARRSKSLCGKHRA